MEVEYPLAAYDTDGRRCPQEGVAHVQAVKPRLFVPHPLPEALPQLEQGAQVLGREHLRQEVLVHLQARRLPRQAGPLGTPAQSAGQPVAHGLGDGGERRAVGLGPCRVVAASRRVAQDGAGYECDVAGGRVIGSG